MNTYDTKDLPDFVEVKGKWSRESSLKLSPTLKSNKLFKNLVIARMGSDNSLPKFDISIGDFTGRLVLLFGTSGKVVIGNCGKLNMDIRSGHNSVVVIGDKTTCNGARIVAVNSDIEIGEDVMLSDEILVQGFDQHGIIKKNTGEIINNRRGQVLIGRHVWIGRRATILPHSNVGEGTIVGACSVVTKTIEPFSLAVGNPAKLIKREVTWSRSWMRLDSDTKSFLKI